MKFDTAVIGYYIYQPRNPDIKKIFFNYLSPKNLWICQFVYRKTVELCENIRIKRELDAGVVKEKGSFSRKSFLEIERSRMWIVEKARKGELEKLWQENSMVILEIKRWCEQRGVVMVVALFPDEFQVEKDLRQEIYNEYNLVPASLELGFPNNLVLDFCQQMHIHCLDLSGRFRESAQFSKLYLVRDTHWNEEGNKLAAEAIFNFIEKNKLIKVE